MTVTMLYFDTISKWIKELGYTWADVNKITDHDERVVSGEWKCSLREAFRFASIGGFDESSDYAQRLKQAFETALQEAKSNN